MGRGASYSTHDYANRIELFLHQNGGNALTEEIMRNVTGTDFRLVDGLHLLYKMGVVTDGVYKHKVRWILTDRSH